MVGLIAFILLSGMRLCGLICTAIFSVEEELYMQVRCAMSYQS